MEKQRTHSDWRESFSKRLASYGTMSLAVAAAGAAAVPARADVIVFSGHHLTSGTYAIESSQLGFSFNTGMAEVLSRSTLTSHYRNASFLFRHTTNASQSTPGLAFGRLPGAQIPGTGSVGS